MDTVIDRVLNTPLTVPLSIYPGGDHFEFRTAHSLDFTSNTSVFRTLSDIYDGFFLRNLNKSEQIGPKIL